MKIKLPIIRLGLLLSVSILLNCKGVEVYDMVVLNGYVLSENSEKFIKSNIGITNGKIAVISKSPLVGKKTIDANNQFVYPGFMDAHCHLWGYAKGLLEVNLVGTKSISDVINRISIFRKKHPNQKMIYGYGWDQNDWGQTDFPTHEWLSSHFPETPIFLTRIDGHAAWLNKAAMDVIAPLPNEIDGGQIVIVNNMPTGIFIDNATQLLPKNTYQMEQMKSALKSAEQNCFEAGLTSLADAGLPFSVLERIDSLQRRGELKMPIYAMVANGKNDVDKLFANQFISTELLEVKSIKVYADGALGSRGASLLEPYSDAPATRGIEITHDEDLLALCKKAKENNIQVNVHAIGDSANKMVLRVFAKVLQGENDLRWRVEHAQIVDPADSIYFINYSILPSVQPTHATSDMYWAEKRLGHTRVSHAYAYRDLLRWSGNRMPLGTDFPVEDISPLKTFYAAVARKDSVGYPAEGFFPNQKITRTEALKGMTIWAAFAQFDEDNTGSIERGKWANLIFSETNLLECAENEILQTEINQTILRGVTVFKQEMK